MRTFEEEPLPLHDYQNVTSCLKETALNKNRSDVYWLWHDLLDVLDAMAPTRSITHNHMKSGNTLRNYFCNLTSFAKPVCTG